MAVLVQTIIDQVRLLSNLKNNQFYSDDDIGGFVNDAALELDDIFTDAVEHYSQSYLDFTLVGGVGLSAQQLPTDMLRMQQLLMDPTSSSPQRVDPMPNLAERGSGDIVPGFGRRYILAGDSLEIWPNASAAGSFRLFYTPQLGSVWPVPPDTTVRLATAGAMASVVPAGAGVGATLTALANGALTIDSIGAAAGDRVLIWNASVFASDVFSGIYVVTNAGSGGTKFVLTRAADWDEAREIHVGASIKVTAGAVNTGLTFRVTAFQGAVDVAAQTFASTVTAPPALPQRLVPWQLFLKAHAAITVVQGRKQPMPDGLQLKYQQQHDRAVAMSKNRTEGVTQAPIQRRRRSWWYDNP